ncbi:MAG TPA: redoxin domain-containing protein [Terriglobia bacterium]
MKRSVAVALFAMLAGVILMGSGTIVGLRAQEPSLEAMHVPAPEFPPPSGFASPGGDLAGAAPQAAPQASQRPTGIGSQPGTNLPGSIPPQGEAAGGVDSGAVTWINSRPLTMFGLRGKVVMIDFWEPTCINCIRTFPVNKRWWERYRDDGFEIVGVEDPEFDIAHSLDHVREAVKRFGLPYPILVDSRFQVWNAYKSNSWPNRFLIDAQGIIRYHIEGEGSDGEFERAIQQLLKEAHPDITFPSTGALTNEDVAAPGCGGAPTPEMYVGDWSGRGILANPEGYHDGKTIDYQPQNSVEDGRAVVSGRWETDKNGMIYRGKHKGNEPGEDRVTMRYHARELYAVMNVSHGHPSRLYIMQDGKYLTAANKGVDVEIDGQGRSYIEVREPRMYYVVQNREFGSHTVELFPTGSGLTLNSFTFGNSCQTAFDHL